MVRFVRGTGWLLIASGTIVLLYVVYLLWFTGLETARAQSDLAQAWDAIIRDVPAQVDDDDDAPVVRDDVDDEVALGEAYAAIWFERDGVPIIHDDPLYVVEGVTLDHLRAGPGHYPESDRPGGSGNFAIAGHRTTYGAPFWSVDELTDGDTIHVVDRQGREWVYAYREQRIVRPTAVWVVDRDPLETGKPTLTLTSCHPRGSARERIIVWGELVGDPLAPPVEVPDDA